MAQSTISQRIALEGAEEILKQLADLGQAGEKAIGQIQQATAGAGPSLTSLSGVVGTLRGALGEAAVAFAPVRTAFAELGEAAHEVGTRLTEVASIFGVGLAAGIAGGIAGIFELIKSSAESAHQLEVQSEVLGISILNLKTFGAAAALAGVDSDKLNTALTRFQQNVGKQSEQLFQDTIKLIQLLPSAASQAGVSIARGFAPAGDAIKAHIIGNITDAVPAVNTALDLIRKELSEHGIALPETAFQGIRQDLLNVAGDATKTAETIRLLLAQLGVNLPAQTIFEQLAVGAQKAKNPLLELGISLGDLQKLNITEVILKAADALEKMGPTTERARLSLQLFGRTWPEVLKALRDGSEGFEQLRAKVAANNPDLDENVKKLSESEKALIVLQNAGKNLKDQLSAIFAPALTNAAEAFTKLIKDNIDTFKAWATIIAEQLLPGIKNLTGQLGETAKAAPAAAHSLPDVISGKTGTGVAQISAPQAEVFGPPAAADTSSLEDVNAKLDAVRTKIAAFKQDLMAFQAAAEFVLFPLRLIAGGINLAFGTNLNAAGAAALLFVGKVTGLFTVITKLSELTLLALGGLVRYLGGPLGTALGAIGLPAAAAVIALGLLVVGIIKYRDQITQALSDAQAALGNFLQQNVGDRINALFANVSFEPLRQGVIRVLKDARHALDNFLQIFADFFEKTIPDLVTRALGFLQPLFDAVARVAKGVLGLGSGGGSGGGGGDFSGEGDFSSADSPGLGLDSAATTSTFAVGGRVPGGPSGTDTVPAWLTPGEFVVRAQAVGHYGSNLLHSINNMRLPFADMLQGLSLGGMVGSAMDSFAPSPSPLMLAAGGAVLAPPSGSGGGGPMHALTLNLGGESFKFDVSPGHVYDKLARHARSSAMASAGRKPSWFAG